MEPTNLHIRGVAGADRPKTLVANRPHSQGRILIYEFGCFILLPGPGLYVCAIGNFKEDTERAGRWQDSGAT